MNRNIRAMVVFQNFRSIRVSFSSDVRINGGTGLYLLNSQLEIHGYCEIISASTHAAILSPDSTLLLANNSLLNMSNIHVCSMNLQPQGAIKIDIDGTDYKPFFDCYVDKTTCPGHCFFQFIDGDSGRYIQNGRNFVHFNATIDIICDYSEPNETPPPKIMNGHLFGCSLQTREGTDGVTVTDYLLAHVFNTSMDKLKQQSYSPLYSICLCSTPLSAFPECQRNVSLELYPVSQFQLSLVVVRDFLRPAEAQVKLVMSAMDIINTTKHYNVIRGTITGCTNIPTLHFADGIVQHRVNASATPRFPDPRLFNKQEVKVNKVIHIKLANKCPPGMKLNSVVAKDSISLCSCNQHMSHHGFTCTTDGITCSVSGIHFKLLGWCHKRKTAVQSLLSCVLLQLHFIKKIRVTKLE